MQECHARITGMAFLPQPSLLVVVGEQGGLEEAPTADQLDAKLTLSVHNLADPAHAELTVLKRAGRASACTMWRTGHVPTSSMCLLCMQSGPSAVHMFLHR